MINLEEFYILGLPIETERGDCHFIKVMDYPKFILDLETMVLTKAHIINRLSKFNADHSLDEVIKVFNQQPLYEIIIHVPEMAHSYQNVFKHVFQNEEVFSSITVDEFDSYRQLILKMNCMKEEKINPNPEIQMWIEKSKRAKQQEGGTLTFSDIVTSVVGFNGLSYRDINEMTIFQLYMTFYRINQIKGYDTSTLFATVAEKVKVESWCKHIDLFEEESHGISREEFEKKSQSIF